MYYSMYYQQNGGGGVTTVINRIVTEVNVSTRSTKIGVAVMPINPVKIKIEKEGVKLDIKHVNYNPSINVIVYE